MLDNIKLFFSSWLFRAGELFKLKSEDAMTKTAKSLEPGKLYSFNVQTIDHKDKSMSDYKGNVLFIVNVASLCGFTPQYDGMEKLYEKYKDRGLRVLGFPANEFGKQEPGSDAEIDQFCRTKYSVKFDLFSKIVVKGPGIHPLYQFLTKESGFNGEIAWNFTKFLVNKKGEVIARFGPPDDPMSQNVTKKIEEALA